MYTQTKQKIAVGALAVAVLGAGTTWLFSRKPNTSNEQVSLGGSEMRDLPEQPPPKPSVDRSGSRKPNRPGATRNAGAERRPHKHNERVHPATKQGPRTPATRKPVRRKISPAG